MPYKLAKYDSREVGDEMRGFLPCAWLYSASLYGVGERTYEAIQGVFIVASFSGRIRAVLLHPDVDNICWVTGSTADPS